MAKNRGRENRRIVSAVDRFFRNADIEYDLDRFEIRIPSNHDVDLRIANTIEAWRSAALRNTSTHDIPTNEMAESVARELHEAIRRQLASQQKLRLATEELERASANALGRHQPTDAVGRVTRGFQMVELLVPKRMRNELIGDALETIDRLVHDGQPIWKIYLKAVSTSFWVMVNAVREIVSGLVGKKA
ncbi:MAG TPA: hypothetical protein VGH20_16410 [Myxococcales bacterium]|jgi:C4-dicarboxylate-specific signal transduction histidine kinase